MHRRVFLLCALLTIALFASNARTAEPLRIATFNVDATPEIGEPVAYAPIRSILDPLSARGIVLLPDGEPIVLCAVDWIGIANDGHDAWRNALAEAAGTTPSRVAVHTLHQHDGPRWDVTAHRLLAERGLDGRFFSESFARESIHRAAAAIREGLKQPRTVTHLGFGQAKVEKVASNRRLLGPDGKVKIVRWSKSTNPEAIAAPEGVIDPWLKLVSFWDGDVPLASLTYYATHPQSYYGQGDVTAEFVGLGRAAREQALPEVAHIHFNGAGGNVAAGKYNDGSKQRRPILAARMETGMRLAWEATKKTPVAAADVGWRVRGVQLPLGAHLVEAEQQKILDNTDADAKARLAAASNLSWIRRCRSGHAIELSCLRLGSARVLHMPGELFIEYQLAAQKMRPGAFVCMAAYGDYGPGYIGTQIAYSQGGYETSPRASRVSARVEGVLSKALEELLE